MSKKSKYSLKFLIIKHIILDENIKSYDKLNSRLSINKNLLEFSRLHKKYFILFLNSHRKYLRDSAL